MGDSRRDGGRDRYSPPRGRFSRGNPPGRRTGYRTIVENLSSRTSWQDLKDFMRKAGEITYTNTNQPRVGEGIVEFGSRFESETKIKLVINIMRCKRFIRRDMEYALDKLDGEELDGRRIRLVEEGGNKSRSRSRSRDNRRRSSRDRSPSSAKSESRSRSRSRSKKRRTRSRS